MHKSHEKSTLVFLIPMQIVW